MSRHKRFADFYAKNDRSALAKSLNDLTVRGTTFDAADKFAFRGERTEVSAVVRVDLNGYSKWAESRPLTARRDLLDEYFTHVVSNLDLMGGVYFRDEGDCIVALFSNYFGIPDTKNITNFCMSVVSRNFGQDKLTAKAVCSIGNLAFYQKAHEVGSADWSAEGQPFVIAARMEAAIDSKPAIYFPHADWRTHFESKTTYVSPGQRYYWLHSDENIQVQGLALEGGWMKTRKYTYIPDGATL